ncbi:MAG: YicC family protein [Bacteroidales bacterium]|nr:YicC family protein [Bacteroidales bacterium]
MVSSMTGFGRALWEVNGKKISIDVKSLNSKSVDISTRLPQNYKDKDIEIRRFLAEKLERGKIDFSLNLEADTNTSSINTDAVVDVYDKISAAFSKKDICFHEPEVLVASIIRMNEVQNSSSEVTDEEWSSIMTAIESATQKCIEYRLEEGKTLAKDVCEKVEKIRKLLAEVPQYESERIDAIKERLQQSIKSLSLADQQTDIRFEEEIIYYLEKLDINEEKVRLAQHCRYFDQTIAEEKAPGRKLGFIAQEMGREINTLGSKAHHTEIQKLVVMMKDELEKIKEQVLNIL